MEFAILMVILALGTVGTWLLLDWWENRHDDDEG